MEKFILVTRGRTGSTAVIDELGKSNVLVTTQELFIRFPVLKNSDYYKLLVPFDLWEQEKGGWWTRLIPSRYREARRANRYLLRVEELAQRQGAKGLGWKLLSHHFDERPFLSSLLRQHGYRAIYLKRKSVRQVLSGMVAKQRGKYNSLEQIVDNKRYHIDLEKFKWHVQWERECVKNDCLRLKNDGFEFIEVNYEDYCDNREAFFGPIFNLLNLPLEIPPPSDFVKMIDDLKAVIENYDEVAAVAAELGEAL